MSVKPDMPIIIDVEASGFGAGSYPIEVGVAFADAECYCSLIRPEPEWLHWNEKSQSLHGIKREQLIKHGRGVDVVARQLNESLNGKTVYSDAWGNDMVWVSLLFHHAGLMQTFTVDALPKLLSEEQKAIWSRTKQQVIEEHGFNRHRASSDARILQMTYCQALAAVD